MSEVILPDGWVETEWNNITTLDGFRRGPFGGNLKKAFFVKEGYAIYEQYAPINNDCIKFRYFITEEKYQELSSFWVEQEDFLISCSGTMGRITQVPEGSPKGVINQALLRIRLNNTIINPNFFLKLFRSPITQEKILTKSVGGAIQNLAAVNELKKIKLPIPPLAEQKVIADLLDQLIAQVDKLKLRLKTILTTLKQFRQSVLNAAVTGKLTEDWRKENHLNNWKLFLFEDLIITSGNGISKRQGTKGKYTTVLRLADFQNGKRIYGKERTILLTETELNKYKLQLNDLLVIRVNGSRDIAGLFTIYKENKVEAFCDHFIRFSVKQTLLNPNYFLYVANEGKGRQFFIQSLSTSAGQNTINQKSIKSFSFLLPSLTEQQEIVNRVENYFAFADKIEQQVKSAQERVNNLTPALLAKAFKGELTADWRTKHPELTSGENSAKALLKRIQVEQEILNKPAKTKRTKI